MRRELAICIWMTTVVTMASVHAYASGEASFFVGRSNAGDLALDDMTTFGGTLGAYASILGFEFGLEYSPISVVELGPVGLGASITNIMGNVVLQIPAGRVIPFATAGYGAVIGRASIEDLPVDFVGTLWAFNFGFGARVFITETIGLRVDYRRFAVQTDEDDPNLVIPLTNIRVDTSPDLDRFAGGVTLRF